MAFNELRAITTFIHAAELGTLRGAAAAQGLTPQAASEALARLEAHLGVRLFHRTTRRLSLTEEGTAFLDAARPGLRSLERAVEVARRGQDTMLGPIRITGPRSIVMPVVWPALGRFCQRHPEVEPHVMLDDRLGDWVQNRVDVGFRAGSPPADGVIARQLFRLQLVVCAAPAYLARHGAPQRLDDLAQHRCSGFRHPGTGKLMPWEFRVGQDVVARDVASVVNTDDVELEADMVQAGLAIGQLVGVTAAPLIRSGKLVPLLIEHVTDHLGVHLYYGSRVAQPARVRAFIDHVVGELSDTSAFVLSADELAAAARHAST